MAKDSSSPTVDPSTLDWNQAKSHIQDVENYLKEFAGKPKMNPFLWAGKNIHPLKIRLERGERTLDLWNQIAALQKEEPVVDISVNAEPVKIHVAPAQS